ncbi:MULTISPECIES: PIN domain-containing protein, partial [Muribaculaceae]
DLVVAEIADADQRRIFDELVARGEISVDGFTADEVIEIVEEHSSVSGNLSIPDCSVCYFARKHNVPMLTGDRRLRRYAEEQSIEVHGILFIFDELVRHDIISTSMAADRLEELFAINARLPKAEIRDRINRWRNN